MTNDTCVYLHTRSDGVVFYVGIGNPERPYVDKRRNAHWKATTSRYAYMVTVLHTGLTWDAACAIEIDLIKKYRELSGSKLCNMVDGGDGAKGWTHSDSARKRISAATKGNTNTKGLTFSPETRANMRVAAKVRMTEDAKENLRDHNLGKVLTEEHRLKIGTANRGRVFSEEHRAKLSAAHKGKPMSEETRARMSAGQKVRYATP